MNVSHVNGRVTCHVNGRFTVFEDYVSRLEYNTSINGVLYSTYLRASR